MSCEEKNLNNEEIKEETIQEEVPETDDSVENAEETETAEEAETEEEAEATEESQEAEEEPMNMQYMRLMADFQNYKKRVEKEKSDIFAYANEKIVTQLLDVIDSFERALAVESADEGFVEGMKMIFKQFMEVLEKSGLEEINALGEDFDPNFHNAIMMEDNPEYESGKVTLVMQKGYLLNKKVIRPSMVKVNN